jgi:folate-binding protein YgfZ
MTTLTTPSSALTLNLPIQNIATFEITGIDAAQFLQGQLTQDILHWQPNEIKRAAWCNVKGRMIASFYIWQIDNGFRLLVAQDLVHKVLPKLRLFVLRAKVLISEPLAIHWFTIHSDATHLTHTTIQGLNSYTTLNLLAKNSYTPYSLALTNISNQNDFKYSFCSWNLAHIQTGAAWIDASNTEKFVPQSINFELINGVNFRKGCYPGQEVIARNQYLGKLKQRAAIATLASIPTQQILEALLINNQIDIFDSEQAHNPVGKVILLSQSITDVWVLFTTSSINDINDMNNSNIINNIDNIDNIDNTDNINKPSNTFYISIPLNDSNNAIKSSNQTMFISKLNILPLPYSIIDITK